MDNVRYLLRLVTSEMRFLLTTGLKKIRNAWESIPLEKEKHFTFTKWKKSKFLSEAKPQVVQKSICKSLPDAEADLGWSWVNKSLV